MSGPQQRSQRMAAAERRALIMSEARGLFGRRGYAGTRIEDIATAAGVTKPIVYRHFGSKKDLYLAVLRKHEDDLPTFLEGVEAGGAADQIEAILDGWLDYARLNSHSWLMLFRDHSGGEDIQAARTQVSIRARQVLAGFVAERATSIPDRSVVPVAEILTSGLAGLILWWTDNPDVPKETVLDAASRVCASILAT